MDNKNEEKKNIKFIRNKISCLLISFYSGICVISDLGVKYYYKDIKKVDASLLSKILLLFKIPYAIKPFYGLILDFFPLCGYKKKYYLFICFLINISSWYIFIAISNKGNLIKTIICQLFVNISLSFTAVIGSAIQVEVSKMYENSKNSIGERTSSLMSEYFIVRSIGTLIPSYLKGFLIEKYTNNIIFYISGLISFFIFLSGLILDDDKVKKEIKKQKKVKFSPLLEEEENNNENNKTSQIINLLKDKNIFYLLFLVFILESSPSCVSPLFFYYTNMLGLNPKDLSLIDFFSQISIIIVNILYKFFCQKLNFKCITFFVRISLFCIFYLIYMLIMKITQQYISDLILVTFTSSLHEGLHILGQLPYYLLGIILSPLELEATTYSLCISSCYLGNMLADFIDSRLAIFFNVTHYNFKNLGILILIENIFHLIPLIILVIPNQFFSEIKSKSQNTSTKELVSLDKDKN